MDNNESNLGLAMKSLGMENVSFPLPEHITRGLNRTRTIGRTESGLPITAEAELVAAQLRLNAAKHLLEKSLIIEEVENHGE